MRIKRKRAPGALALILIGPTLVSCAQLQAQQRQTVEAAAIQQRKEEYAACQAKFSQNNKDARASCLNDADKKFAPVNDEDK